MVSSVTIFIELVRVHAGCFDSAGWFYYCLAWGDLLLFVAPSQRVVLYFSVPNDWVVV
jgi:hypothetical protein